MSSMDKEKSKRPTHFLALRIQSPQLYDHVWILSVFHLQINKIQEEMLKINSDYRRILVYKELLHLTLGVIGIYNEEDYKNLMYVLKLI